MVMTGPLPAVQAMPEEADGRFIPHIRRSNYEVVLVLVLVGFVNRICGRQTKLAYYNEAGLHSLVHSFAMNQSINQSGSKQASK